VTTAPARVEVLDPGPAEEAQRRVAGALHSLGLEPGDRVAFSMPSSADLLNCVLGAARCGVVPVLLNATLLDNERDPLITDADPSLVVTDPGGLAPLLAGQARDIAPCPIVRPMHYTSGTTGRPKGVWSGVLDDGAARDLFEDEAGVWDFSAADTHLVCSPMYHSVSIRLAATSLLRGGRVIVLSRFDAGVATDALVRFRPTTTFLAPTALQRRLTHPGSTGALDSLRLLNHAGSPCPAGLKRAAMEVAPEGAVWEFYGSTEGQFTVCAPAEWEAHPGTVGRARPGRQIHVEDDIVWCTAPRFARFEYWRDPDATARAWKGDAFTVGDMGRLDADGYIYLDGRRDDLVITGGVNVYPVEVEAVLCELPGVTEVAVFGVHDPDWGERVCAAVVGSAAHHQLERHARARLAPYKRPKTYVTVGDLPRTATGKLRRRDLPELLGLVPPPGPGGP